MQQRFSSWMTLVSFFSITLASSSSLAQTQIKPIRSSLREVVRIQERHDSSSVVVSYDLKSKLYYIHHKVPGACAPLGQKGELLCSEDQSVLLGGKGFRLAEFENYLLDPESELLGKMASGSLSGIAVIVIGVFTVGESVPLIVASIVGSVFSAYVATAIQNYTFDIPLTKEQIESKSTLIFNPKQLGYADLRAASLDLAKMVDLVNDRTD